jgi:hypothetical protein
MRPRLFLLTQIFAETLFFPRPAKIVGAFTGRIQGGEVRVTL